MSWSNPWGWLGLATLAIPLVLHLLSRQHARREPFPSLRFLGASRLTPARQRRLSDVPLLLLRLGILAAATMALARPVFGRATRDASAARAGSRAIVIDSSASMRRVGANGRHALDTARALATRTADSAATSTILESGAPASAIPGAIAWLATQPVPRELVVLSDFQRGTLDAAAAATVPTGMGLRLVPIVSAAPDSTIVSAEGGGTSTVTTRTMISPSSTTVEWHTTPASADTNGDSTPALEFVFDARDSIALRGAAIAAGVRVNSVPSRPHAVAIVFVPAAQVSTASNSRDANTRDANTRDANAPGRSASYAGLPIAYPVREIWMLRVIDQLRGDSILRTLATTATAVGRAPAPAIVLFRDALGRSVLSAGMDSVGPRRRLLLFVDADVAAVLSTALMAATARALREPIAWSEFETARIPADSLRRWSRAPMPARTLTASDKIAGSDTRNDGRWIWGAVIALMAAEWFARRRSTGDAENALGAAV